MSRVWSKRLLWLLGAALFWLLGDAQSNLVILGFGFAVLGVAGLLELLTLLRAWRDEFAMTSLCAASLMIWYGIGTWMSLWFADAYALGMEDQEDVSLLALSGGLVLGSVLGLWLFEGVERPWWRPLPIWLGQLRWPNPVELGLLAVVALALAYALSQGLVLFRDVAVDEESQQRVAWVVVLAGLVQGLIAFLAWMLGRFLRVWGEPGRSASIPVGVYWAGGILASVLLLMAVFLLLGDGRRALFFQALLFVLFFYWGYGRRFTKAQWLLVVATAAPLVVVGSLVFQTQRALLTSVDGPAEGSDIVSSVGVAGEVLASDVDGAIEWQAENIPQRLFIIFYLKELLAAEDPQFGLGMEHVAEAALAVPPFILADKEEFVSSIGGAMEGRNSDFGLPVVSDYANTLLSSAYVDFSWFGVLLLPLVVLLNSRLMLWLMAANPSGLFRVLVLGLLLSMHLSPERIYVQDMVLNLRMLLAVFVPFYLAFVLGSRLADNRAPLRV